MAELINVVWHVHSARLKEACIRCGPYQRHLVNTSEPSICSGNAPFLSNYFVHLLLFKVKVFTKRIQQTYGIWPKVKQQMQKTHGRSDVCIIFRVIAKSFYLLVACVMLHYIF